MLERVLEKENIIKRNAFPSVYLAQYTDITLSGDLSWELCLIFCPM